MRVETQTTMTWQKNSPAKPDGHREQMEVELIKIVGCVHFVILITMLKKTLKNISAIWKIYSDLKCLEYCSFTLSQSREKTMTKDELYHIIVWSVLKHFIPLRAQANKNSHTLHTPPHKRLHDKSSVVVKIWFKWPENVHTLRWCKVGWWFAGLGTRVGLFQYLKSRIWTRVMFIFFSILQIYLEVSI